MWSYLEIKAEQIPSFSSFLLWASHLKIIYSSFRDPSVLMSYKGECRTSQGESIIFFVSTIALETIVKRDQSLKTYQGQNVLHCETDKYI